MKKLFVSQPMNRRNREEILAEREKAVKAAVEELGEEAEVIDSYFGDVPEGTSPLALLGKSIELLSEADVVYFAPDWIRARGCVIEHSCAEAYGIKCIYAPGNKSISVQEKKDNTGERLEEQYDILRKIEDSTVATMDYSNAAEISKQIVELISFMEFRKNREME